MLLCPRRAHSTGNSGMHRSTARSAARACTAERNLGRLVRAMVPGALRSPAARKPLLAALRDKGWAKVLPPRSSERGPVEVSLPTSFKPYTARLPRSGERGPIESEPRSSGGLKQAVCLQGRRSGLLVGGTFQFRLRRRQSRPNRQALPENLVSEGGVPRRPLPPHRARLVELAPPSGS